jgi:NADPH:quinone reductase-like Zn-dependent oxidoreductase
MKAIVQRAYGDADVLKLEEIDRPGVGADDVLVRVRAAGLNHADWVYTSGTPLIARLAFGLRRPRMTVRGKDVAGIIEAVGANVTAFRPGDHVYGELESGTFAEHVAAPASLLARKPANLSFEQAATVPLSGMTALLGLRDAAAVTAGQRVLINGASGGVGTFAVQIAKALGAEVTAVCSARNASLAVSLGADSVIDYGREDFTLGAADYDVIFDLVGNHSLAALRRVLTPNGTLVLSSGTGGRVFGPMGRILRAVVLAPLVRHKLVLIAGKRNTATLDDLRTLIEAGQVTPAIDRSFSLAQTQAAMRYFVTEHARAKIVITAGDDFVAT